MDFLREPSSQLESLKKIILDDLRQDVLLLNQKVKILNNNINLLQDPGNVFEQIEKLSLERKNNFFKERSALDIEFKEYLKKSDPKKYFEGIQTDLFSVFDKKSSGYSIKLEAKLKDFIFESFKNQIENDEAHISSLFTPIVTSGLSNQIAEKKEKIVDALYPVIGSTISKYLSEALKDMVDNINQKLEERFSINSFKRKLKSKIIGVSEVELVFREGLQANLKSIFLIHRKTGVMIAHATENSKEKKNMQMLGGMFTAISSFVNNWIQSKGELAELDSIQYGNESIFFETSGSLIAASVSSGGNQKQIKNSIRKFLELLHTDFSEAIDEFSGDLTDIPDELHLKIKKLIELPEKDEGASIPKVKNKILYFLSLVIISTFLIYFLSFKKNCNLIGGLLTNDPLLSRLDLSINCKGLKKVSIKGSVTNEALFNRLKFVVNSTNISEHAQFDIDLSKVKISQISKLPDEFNEKKKEIYKYLDKIDSLVIKNIFFDLNGILHIRGIGELSLSNMALLEERFDIFGTEVDLTSLTSLSENIISFEVGFVELNQENEKKLDEIIKNNNINKSQNYFILPLSNNGSVSRNQLQLNDLRVNYFKRYLGSPSVSFVTLKDLLSLNSDFIFLESYLGFNSLSYLIIPRF